MIENFTDIGVPEDVARAMADMGWEEPTPIQTATIRLGIEGRDMFGQAQTGTGKTGAFGSIILGRIQPGQDLPRSIILLPTRELALQAYREMTKLAKYTGHVCVPVYGGQGGKADIEKQISTISKGADIIAGTPGRVRDLVTRGALNLTHIEVFVLDEADRMLDMGFIEDIEFLLKAMSRDRQTLLFSATMAENVKRLAYDYMKEPKEITVSEDEVVLDLTKQYYIPVGRRNKSWALCRLLDSGSDDKYIIFCQTIKMVDMLEERMEKLGYKVEAIHGDLPQTKLSGYGEPLDYVPTRKVIIPVDSAKVIANGVVKPEDAGKIVKQLEIDLKGNSLNKSQLMVLDIIANADWERPVYFGIGMGTDAYMGFEKYFQLEGAAYRLVPIETKDAEYFDYGRIDSDILYDNLMNKFEWGNIKDPKVNIDYFHDNTIAVMKYRNTFLRLAEQLYKEGKNDKAIAALDKCMEELPLSQVPVDNTLLNYIPLYYQLGATDKANHLLKELAENNYQTLKYTNSLSPKFARMASIQQEEGISIQVIRMLLSMAYDAGQDEVAKEITQKVESIYNPVLLQPDRQPAQPAGDSAQPTQEK